MRIETVLAAAFLLTACTVDPARSPAPTAREKGVLTFAPEVPPPLKRKTSAIVEVHLDASITQAPVDGSFEYKFWGFNGRTPGPMIRARVGDTLEVHVTNSDKSGMPHNIDFHAVSGPGGGAGVLTVAPGEEQTAWFRLLYPGLFMYHCAVSPVMDHIANGMYGAILVEPADPLPAVDHEYYVVQSEIYTKPTTAESGLLEYSHEAGANESPRYVVFNGSVGSLVGDGALKANTGDDVRIYFVDAGPNLPSSFHVIGTIFDRVWREGGFLSPPDLGIQTTLVPAGGATVVDFRTYVPGIYTLVDHAIFRVEKGAAGFVSVSGEERPDLFLSKEASTKCENCLLHP